VTVYWRRLRAIVARLRGSRLGAWAVRTFRWFELDEGPLRASALAYRTLMTLVPLLAIVVALLQSAGVASSLRPFLQQHLPMLDDASAAALLAYVERASASSIGSFGAIGLAYAAWGMLNEIERALNQIFGAPRSRRLLRRSAEYLAMLTIGTAVVALSVSVRTMLAQPRWLLWILGGSLGSEAAGLSVMLVPWISTWAGLTLLYVWVPNLRVPFRWTALGALWAAVVLQLLQIAFIELQFAFAGYHAIYGALAQLPILLIFVYTSWLIVLLGAEGVAAAVASRRSERGRSDASLGSGASAELLRHVLGRFEAGLEPLRVSELEEQLELSREQVVEGLRPWIQADILRLDGRAQSVVFVRTPRQLDLDAVREGLVEPEASGRPASKPPSNAESPHGSSAAPELRPELDSEPDSKPDFKPDSKPGSKPDSKWDSKRDSKRDPKPD